MKFYDVEASVYIDVCSEGGTYKTISRVITGGSQGLEMFLKKLYKLYKEAVFGTQFECSPQKSRTASIT